MFFLTYRFDSKKSMENLKCVISGDTQKYRMSAKNSVQISKMKPQVIFCTSNQNCYRHSFVIPSYWQFSSFFPHIYKEYPYIQNCIEKMPDVSLFKSKHKLTRSPHTDNER